MKFNQKIIGIIFLTLTLWACGMSSNKTPFFPDDNRNNDYGTKDEEGGEPGYGDGKNESAPTDETSLNQNKLVDDLPINPNPMHTLAAIHQTGDTSRKFLKTADIKFRVNNVFQATYAIEELTWKYDGFVSYTNLQSQIDRTTTVPVSPDSLLETVYYTVTNTFTLRVPSTKLDSLLRSFTPLVEYLDYRIVESTDIRLQLLANRLTQERVRQHQERISKSASAKTKDMDDVLASANAILQRQEQADNSTIETLSLLDQVAYSTVTLHIYQRQSIKRELIPNFKNTDAYEAGFWFKAGQSIKIGWKAFTGLIIFLLRFWILFIVMIVAVIVLRQIARKYK